MEYERIRLIEKYFWRDSKAEVFKKFLKEKYSRNTEAEKNSSLQNPDIFCLDSSVVCPQ